MVKLDMSLVRGIDSSGPEQAISRAVFRLCQDLGIDFVVEGVESAVEYQWCSELGVELFPGLLFAKPSFESIPPVRFPNPDRVRTYAASGEANPLAIRLQ